MEQEIWRDIVGFEGSYQVSNFGRVKSVNRFVTYINGRVHIVEEKILKLRHTRRGYAHICLVDANKKKYNKSVHRLVAQAFIPNLNNLPQVNHLNEIRKDNNVANLEWCSAEYNLNYGNRNRLASETLGKDVIQLTMNGEFICRHSGTRNAARSLKLNPNSGANIAACAHHRRNSAYGYKWEWA